MKRKSFGVPKWSQPRRDTKRGVRQGLEQRVGRTGEIPVAEDDQHRAVDAGQIGRIERRGRPAHAGGQGGGVVAGSPGESGKRLSHGRIALGCLARFDGPGRRFGIPAAEQAGADATHHQPAESVGIGSRHPQQQLGAQRKADGVDRPVAGRALTTSCSRPA